MFLVGKNDRFAKGSKGKLDWRDRFTEKRLGIEWVIDKQKRKSIHRGVLQSLQRQSSGGPEFDCTIPGTQICV